MSKKVVAALTACTAVLLLPTLATAKSTKKSVEPAVAECPVDDMIRVANAESLRRFTLLAGCDDQIVEAEAVPQAPRAPIRIAPSVIEIETDQSRFELTSAAAPVPQDGAAADPASILTQRPATYKTSFDETIEQVAVRHSVDPLLLHAVIKQESGYRQTVRSHAGALGLMQIMPATGASLGVATPHLFNAHSNIDAGARLIKKLYYKYKGDFSLVLAAYNAGEGAVAKYGNRIPPYRETQNYVKSVMANYTRLVNDLGVRDPGN